MSSHPLQQIVGDIWLSPDLIGDFTDICDTGGRVAGTESEAAAQELLMRKVAELGGEVRTQEFTVRGRRSTSHGVTLVDTGRVLESYPLLNCADTNGPLTLEVVDLGRGTPVDFEGAKHLIAGRAVLVRHEFPFSTNHVHRGVKYALAQEYGAKALLVGNNQPGAGPVSGSGGSGDETDIPAFGLSFDSAQEIMTASAYGTATVTVSNASSAHEWVGRNIFAHWPGSTDERVVLSAHIDGHGLAESAMDNGTGLATVLEVARRLAPHSASFTRGLTLALFTFEEWALTGSKEYVDTLSEEERALVYCNINVDTPVGYPRVFGLTAGNPRILELLRRASRAGGTPVQPIYAYTSNSDHFNFLEAGIPAVRLIGGYNDDAATSRLLLTAADTRHRVEPLDLRHGAMVTATIALEALTGESIDATPPAA